MEEELRKLLDRLPEVYQRIYRADELGIEDGNSRRGCEPRLDSILKEEKDIAGRTVLDIGSNMGYFSLSLAERGAYVVGIEPDERFRDVANYLARKFGLEKKVMFIAKPLNTNLVNFLIRNFAHFDLILYLSLWHHFIGTNRWERFVGKGLRAKLIGQPIWKLLGFRKHWEQNQRLLNSLARLGSTLYFETGQSDEDWCRFLYLLPDMGNNPGEWIMNNILGAPIFKEKRIIGGNVPHTSHKPRYFIRSKIDYPAQLSFYYPYETFPADTALSRGLENTYYTIDIERMRMAKGSDDCIDDPEIFPPDRGRGFIFGGNINDIIWAGVELDYHHLAHSLVDKVFLLHKRHSLSLHDIRPWNVLFSLRDYDVYLADIGEARPLADDPESDITFLRLTLYYMLKKTAMIGEPLMESATIIEDYNDFVRERIGDFGGECAQKDEFHRLIDELRK